MYSICYKRGAPRRRGQFLFRRDKMQVLVLLVVSLICAASGDDGSNESPGKKANDMYGADLSGESPADPAEDPSPDASLAEKTSGQRPVGVVPAAGSPSEELPKIFGQIFNGSIPAIPAFNSSISNPVSSGISNFFEQVASAVGSLSGGVPPTVEPVIGTTGGTNQTQPLSESVTPSGKTLGADESTSTDNLSPDSGKAITMSGVVGDPTTPEAGSPIAAGIPSVVLFEVGAVPNISNSETPKTEDP